MLEAWKHGNFVQKESSYISVYTITPFKLIHINLIYKCVFHVTTYIYHSFLIINLLYKVLKLLGNVEKS